MYMILGKLSCYIPAPLHTCIVRKYEEPQGKEAVKSQKDLIITSLQNRRLDMP